MNNLYDMIINYKNGDKDSVLGVIDVFNPLLNKLDRQRSGYDVKSDLTVFMIELMNKLPLQNKNFYKDKYIISYISKSIKNKYIYLNKKTYNQCNREEEINLEILDNNEIENDLEMLVFKDLIKPLTNKEKEIITYKYGFNYSDIDISDVLKISRQSVNKTKARALKKLRTKVIYN